VVLYKQWGFRFLLKWRMMIFSLFFPWLVKPVGCSGLASVGSVFGYQCLQTKLKGPSISMEMENGGFERPNV